MPKLIAIANVVAWSGFWAFGYLALTADHMESGQVIMALLLACVGAGVGIFCYLKLVRYNEATGYAKGRNRVVPEHLRENDGEAL
jgi:drug/metabolite transporter (DMT)-like permease